MKDLPHIKCVNCGSMCELHLDFEFIPPGNLTYRILNYSQLSHFKDYHKRHGGKYEGVTAWGLQHPGDGAARMTYSEPEAERAARYEAEAANGEAGDWHAVPEKKRRFWHRKNRDTY